MEKIDISTIVSSYSLVGNKHAQDVLDSLPCNKVIISVGGVPYVEMHNPKVLLVMPLESLLQMEDTVRKILSVGC